MLQSLIRSFVARHRYRRSLWGGIYRRLRGYPPLPPVNIDHLLSYPEENALGPIQRSEAIFLYGLVRTVQPRIIVEFGYNDGHSANNFLLAASAQAVIHSYDNSDWAEKASEHLKNEPRFHFHKKSQADFDPADIGNQKIDLAFIDASHNLELNQTTCSPGQWLSDTEYACCLAERKFVNWITETCPEYVAVNFHSLNVLRHGLTIIQRKARL